MRAAERSRGQRPRRGEFTALLAFASYTNVKFPEYAGTIQFPATNDATQYTFQYETFAEIDRSNVSLPPSIRPTRTVSGRARASRDRRRRTRLPAHRAGRPGRLLLRPIRISEDPQRSAPASRSPQRSPATLLPSPRIPSP